MIVVAGDALTGKTSFLEALLKRHPDLSPIDFEPGEEYSRHAAVEVSLIRGAQVVAREIVNKEIFYYYAQRLRNLEKMSLWDLEIMKVGFKIPPRLVIFLATEPKRPLKGTPYYEILYEILEESADEAAEIWNREARIYTSRITFMNLLASLSRFLISLGKRASPVDVYLVAEDEFYGRIEYLSSAYNTPIKIIRSSLEEALEKASEAIV